MKPDLLKYGWTKTGSCVCSGAYTQYFKLETDAGNYKIKLRAKYFFIETPKQKPTRYSIGELKPILDELFKKYNKKVV